MLLKEFIAQYGALADEDFLAHFSRCFLLEEGQLNDDADLSSRVVIHLTGKGAKPLTVGRGVDADVRVSSNTVSKRHALILPPPAPGGRPNRPAAPRP